MYRLFYDFKTNGDVLFLVYEPETEPDTIKEGNNVTGLFKEGRFIGANFFQIGEVVKLKTSGMIVTPDDALIDVLNTILKQNGLPELPYCRDSGYKVAKIVALEEHPLDEKAQIVTLSLGDKQIETFFEGSRDDSAVFESCIEAVKNRQACWFEVSSKGTPGSAKADPIRVTEPMEWLLWRLGLIKGEGEDIPGGGNPHRA